MTADLYRCRCPAAAPRQRWWVSHSGLGSVRVAREAELDCAYCRAAANGPSRSQPAITSWAGGKRDPQLPPSRRRRAQRGWRSAASPARCGTWRRGYSHSTALARPYRRQRAASPCWAKIAAWRCERLRQSSRVDDARKAARSVVAAASSAAKAARAEAAAVDASWLLCTGHTTGEGASSKRRADVHRGR